ncbi:MAG: hypothetical protein LH609_16325, partial [Rudanella sp.]|nr:hypothetical protein [Rudanella sp.]
DYEKPDSFVSAYYSEIKPFVETNISIENIPALKLPDYLKHSDLENSISFFSVYKNLTHHQATSEAFWSYMTHIQYWDYMQKRWPVSNSATGNQADYIREHYFFKSGTDRALIRNGIARLWWYSKLTYEETAENPFHLTEVLLSQLDIAQGLLERSWGRNNNILRAFLEFLSETPSLMSGSDSNRKRTRFLYKSLTLEGGVSIIDLLPKEEIKAFLKRKLKVYDERVTMRV